MVERRVRAELACIVQVGTVLGENVGMENVKLTWCAWAPGFVRSSLQAMLPTKNHLVLIPIEKVEHG